MKAKIVLAVACLCLLTVYGISQPTRSSVERTGGSVHLPQAGAGATASPSAMLSQPGTVNKISVTIDTDKALSLEQLVTQLENVRITQKALKAGEEDLLKAIDLKVEEQRKALQKAEELRKQLRQEKPQAEKEKKKGVPSPRSPVGWSE